MPTRRDGSKKRRMTKRIRRRGGSAVTPVVPAAIVPVVENPVLTQAQIDAIIQMHTLINNALINNTEPVRFNEIVDFINIIHIPAPPALSEPAAPPAISEPAPPA